MPAAAECYRRVLALDPANVAANAGLASILARDGDSPVARAHADAALSLDPDNAIATAALATMELEAGQPQRARALLEPLLVRTPGPSADRAVLANLLGDALAKLSEPDATYAAYVQSKADFAAIHAARYTSRAPALDFVQRLSARVEARSCPSTQSHASTCQCRSQPPVPARLSPLRHDHGGKYPGFHSRGLRPGRAPDAWLG